MTVVPIEEVACQVAVGPDGLAGPSLAPETKAVIENAEADTDSVDLRRVHCSADQGHQLREYFDSAAAALQARGEYDRSTACAQAAERIRRALDGPELT